MLYFSSILDQKIKVEFQFQLRQWIEAMEIMSSLRRVLDFLSPLCSYLSIKCSVRWALIIEKKVQ